LYKTENSVKELSVCDQVF